MPVHIQLTSFMTSPLRRSPP